jgi:hypothetical protein
MHDHSADAGGDPEVLDAKRDLREDHDVPLDLIVTPDEVIDCGGERPRPEGVDWAALTDAKIVAIPPLQRLRDERR